MSDYQIILNTCPTQDVAQQLAEVLIKNRLAACVNIVPQVYSIYEWQDKIEQESEVLLLIKTRAELYEAIETLVTKLHPYEVPELVTVPIVAGLSAYFSWINEVTQPK